MVKQRSFENEENNCLYILDFSIPIFIYLNKRNERKECWSLRIVAVQIGLHLLIEGAPINSKKNEKKWINEK